MGGAAKAWRSAGRAWTGGARGSDEENEGRGTRVLESRVGEAVRRGPKDDGVRGSVTGAGNCLLLLC